MLPCPKVIAFVLFIFLAGGLAAAQEQPRPAAPAYLLSLVVGFGTGQYYCGSNGIGFLIADGLGIGMMVVGFGNGSASTLSEAGPRILLIEIGAAVFLVSRVWQLLNVFGAVDEGKKAGRLADLVPVIDIDVQRTSLELGFSLRY